MGVARHDIFMHVKPDICIVDEAGQVSEPIVLGPLFHCSKFILVGDPKQLPPLIRSRKARALGADISLMERLCIDRPRLGPFSYTYSMLVNIRLDFLAQKTIKCSKNVLTP